MANFRSDLETTPSIIYEELRLLFIYFVKTWFGFSGFRIGSETRVIVIEIRLMFSDSCVIFFPISEMDVAMKVKGNKTIERKAHPSLSGIVEAGLEVGITLDCISTLLPPKVLRAGVESQSQIFNN